VKKTPHSAKTGVSTPAGCIQLWSGGFFFSRAEFSGGWQKKMEDQSFILKKYLSPSSAFSTLMITPTFKVDQDDATVTITVNTPYVRVSA
jgi:hypothetical protein